MYILKLWKRLNVVYFKMSILVAFLRYSIFCPKVFGICYWDWQSVYLMFICIVQSFFQRFMTVGWFYIETVEFFILWDYSNKMEYTLLVSFDHEEIIILTNLWKIPVSASKFLTQKYKILYHASRVFRFHIFILAYVSFLLLQWC